jgi:pyridoxine/pyridoxamine 5'-phosphate oxidase
MVGRTELLEFMRSVPLATVSAEGAPSAALVGVAVSDRFELVFDTLSTSRKFLNLQHEPRVAVVFGAAGPYKSGSHDERTVQYEGRADVPEGKELERVRETIYFAQFPDGRARLKWAHIAYVRVRPTWIRYSDYNISPPEIIELTGEQLTKSTTSI